MPETGAGTLTWQWTSEGALETTRNGVRIVLGVDPEQGHCVTLIRDGAYDVTDYGKGPYGDLHRAAESSVLAAQIRADFGLGPMGETARPLPGVPGEGEAAPRAGGVGRGCLEAREGPEKASPPGGGGRRRRVPDRRFRQQRGAQGAGRYPFPRVMCACGRRARPALGLWAVSRSGRVNTGTIRSYCIATVHGRAWLPISHTAARSKSARGPSPTTLRPVASQTCPRACAAGPKPQTWVSPCRGARPMPIAPRVSVVTLRTLDLERSTAFYAALGWELSPASTPAMSLFKTAGSLLLLCTGQPLAELGGDDVAAALRGEPTGEAVLSIHVATDGEVAASVEEAAKAGGVVIKRPAATPLGGSYAFFADPDGHVWEVIRHPLYQLGADGRPEVP
jgi:uncharacterized protein